MGLTVRLRPSDLAYRLYRSRWLIYELVSRDLRLRYRGSVLGFAWTLLNPLLFMAVYVVAFGVYLRMGFHNFALYLLSGTLAFGWLSSALQAGTTAILDGRAYVGKTVFPLEVLLLVPVLSNGMNFVFSLPILIIADFLFGQPPGASIVLLPLIMLIEAGVILGLLFFFATLNVFFRDLQQIVQYIVLILFYLVPIFYKIDAVPEQYRGWILWNPIASVIASYHDLLFYGQWPSAHDLMYSALAAIVFLVAGHAYFRRHQDALSEYI